MNPQMKITAYIAVAALSLIASSCAYGPGPPGPTPSPPLTCPYLLTKNNNSYVCSVAEVQEASNNTAEFSFGCSQQYYYGTERELNRRAMSGSLTCSEGQTIKCFIYASYGNVAGSCSECQMGQKCGSCQDCTAKDRCGFSSYGCFNNCVDCFGEVCDPPGSGSIGCAAYYPEAWGASCVGKNSCYIQVSGYGQSASWVSEDGGTSIPVTNQAGISTCHGVNEQAKLKALAVCG